MTIVRELVTLLRYQVENSGLRTYAQQAQNVGRQVSGVGRAAMQGWREGTREALAAYGLVPGRIIQGIREQRRLNAATRGTVDAYGRLRNTQGRFVAGQRRAVRNVRELNAGYSKISGYVRTAVAALASIGTVRLADEWAGVEARVGLATDSINDQRRSLERLYGLAQDNGQDYLATGDLFTAIQRNRKELELQVDQSLQLTDIVGKLMAIGGGSSSSQQAALVQLGQALGSGVLRGDELNSILEQAPRLAQSIADAFGVSVGQLRKLGSEGKLTSKELAAGLLKQAESLNEEFERMPKTWGRGWTLIRNSWGRIVHEFNKGSRASERFYSVAKLIADEMRTIVKVLGFAGLTWGLTKLTQAAGAFRLATLAALAPLLRMAALLGGLYLIGEDLLVWSQGGSSLFGRWFGEYSQWQGTIDGVKEFLTYIKDMLGGSNDELTAWLKKWGAITLAAYALWVVLSPIRRLLWWVGALALPLIAKELHLIAATPLGRFLAFWVAAVLALKWIYDNSDKIAGKIESAFGVTFDRLKQKLEDMVPDWIKWAMRNITGGSVGAEWADGLKDSILGPLNERARRGMGTPQSFRSGDSTINQDITITAPSSNPAALARAAGNEVGRRTEAAVRTGWRVPNVEAMA
ncbi:hypothetical protein CSC67_08700 [Pusillimonas caeni]|uniref:tape measure protein n=1 Tax=Pusillimonas caeni TaxID=1348472 RepID=UPI000E59BCC5|nr:tape measure protein [Pusillimonas caeni]TFL14221.1 hypothetical protein CSC67_08700 [Pusillimonas caeni]